MTALGSLITKRGVFFEKIRVQAPHHKVHKFNFKGRNKQKALGLLITKWRAFLNFPRVKCREKSKNSNGALYTQKDTAKFIEVTW